MISYVALCIKRSSLTPLFFEKLLVVLHTEECTSVLIMIGQGQILATLDQVPMLWKRAGFQIHHYILYIVLVTLNQLPALPAGYFVCCFEVSNSAHVPYMKARYLNTVFWIPFWSQSTNIQAQSKHISMSHFQTLVCTGMESKRFKGVSGFLLQCKRGHLGVSEGIKSIHLTDTSLIPRLCGL